MNSAANARPSRRKTQPGRFSDLVGQLSPRGYRRNDWSPALASPDTLIRSLGRVAHQAKPVAAAAPGQRTLLGFPPPAEHGLHSSFGHVSSVDEEGQVPEEAYHESVVRLYVEPVRPSPVRSDRVLLEPG